MTEQNFEKELRKLNKSVEVLLNECVENDVSEERVLKLINDNICSKASKKMNKLNRTKNVIAFLKVLIITFFLSYLLTRNSITTDILKMIGRKMLINVSFNHEDY